MDLQNADGVYDAMCCNGTYHDNCIAGGSLDDEYADCYKCSAWSDLYSNYSLENLNYEPDYCFHEDLNPGWDCINLLEEQSVLLLWKDGSDAVSKRNNRPKCQWQGYSEVQVKINQGQSTWISLEAIEECETSNTLSGTRNDIAFMACLEEADGDIALIIDDSAVGSLRTREGILYAQRVAKTDGSGAYDYSEAAPATSMRVSNPCDPVQTPSSCDLIPSIKLTICTPVGESDCETLTKSSS